MKINYFEDTDTALIHFTEKKVVETREVSENVYLDLDEQGISFHDPGTCRREDKY